MLVGGVVVSTSNHLITSPLLAMLGLMAGLISIGGTSVTPLAPAVQAAEDPLWKLMHAMYETLNATSRDFTASCWLCYDIKPPFYEAIGLPATYNVLTSVNPSQCSWGDRKIGLTLQHISGKGTCLGKVPQDKQSLCTSINAAPSWNNIKWLTPGSDGWWICSMTGLTPCLSSSVLNASKEFCILVTVIPRILYHSKKAYIHIGVKTHEPKR